MKITAKISKMLAESHYSDSAEWSEVTGLIISQQRKWRKIQARELQKTHDEEIRNLWKDGQMVKFVPKVKRYPGEHLGTIEKRNPKYAKIRVHYGMNCGVWRVHYSSLKEVKEKEDIAKIAIGKLQNREERNEVL